MASGEAVAAAMMQQHQHTQMMDPLWLAMSKLRRRRYDEGSALASQLLALRPRDQAAWYVKCKALTDSALVDDTELEDEGVAELLLDDNAISTLPRPGTSLHRPATALTPAEKVAASTPANRPMSSSGRPLTGFSRPGTASASRPGTSAAVQQTLQTALSGSRPATSRPVSCAGRPVTASGRYVRLGTASLIPDNPSDFVTVNNLDFKRYAKRQALAKVLLNFLLHRENNAAKALELAAECTKAVEFKDWWWKAQIGKSYYRLGLYREAEAQFSSSLRDQEMIETYLWLAKVYLRLDQPNRAREVYQNSSEKFPGEVSLLLGIARIYDALNESPKAVQAYQRVLHFDSSNVEAIACIANTHFYNNQPELALRYYRRLLQMGLETPELWNNLGLSCYYAQQYDMTLHCFVRALALADDDTMADVWYNIGQVAVGLGDLKLAYRCYKIAISIDPRHAESFNNLGVLEVREANAEGARSSFLTAQQYAPYLHDPFYNGAVLLYKLGDFQESYRMVQNALRIFPDHQDSLELKRILDDHFAGV
eukprot:TRINITY_DN1241_c0_g1_i1.p2 TRINITY_DN1241_c0_g1~~TRINITY_DN1241_c0_g1_i1.p2  ORF type:complete len:548 (-),score=185.42 TRINITY_DN1241_c0_g1_i1:2183-3799(-)